MRRDLASSVGGWTTAARLFDAPSQEWLRRAHAVGARIHPVDRLTAVQITSGGRHRSYRDRQHDEHDIAAAALVRDEPAYREQLLTAIAIGSSKMATYMRPLTLARSAVEATVARACAWCGLPPVVLFNALRYRGRGGFIRHVRKIRGLTPAIGEHE
jgi:hypothetical protein